jgi:hypothetical protein
VQERACKKTFRLEGLDERNGLFWPS